MEVYATILYMPRVSSLMLLNNSTRRDGACIFVAMFLRSGLEKITRLSLKQGSCSIPEIHTPCSLSMILITQASPLHPPMVLIPSNTVCLAYPTPAPRPWQLPCTPLSPLIPHLLPTRKQLGFLRRNELQEMNLLC